MEPCDLPLFLSCTPSHSDESVEYTHFSFATSVAQLKSVSLTPGFSPLVTDPPHANSSPASDIAVCPTTLTSPGLVMNLTKPLGGNKFPATSGHVSV